MRKSLCVVALLSLASGAAEAKPGTFLQTSRKIVVSATMSTTLFASHAFAVTPAADTQRLLDTTAVTTPVTTPMTMYGAGQPTAYELVSADLQARGLNSGPTVTAAPQTAGDIRAIVAGKASNFVLGPVHDRFETAYINDGSFLMHAGALATDPNHVKVKLAIRPWKLDIQYHTEW